MMFMLKKGLVMVLVILMPLLTVGWALIVVILLLRHHGR
jgi:hypothetical protein